MVPQGPGKWNLEQTTQEVSEPQVKEGGGAHLKRLVAGVSSRLNSATGTPLDATWGANMAAGYTTDDVPTYSGRAAQTQHTGL